LIVGFTGTTTGVSAIDSSGSRQDLLTLNTFAPISLAFAPTGFGSFGGDLFVASDRTPFVGVLDGSGDFSPFANLPLPANQGLKFVGFAPADFGHGVVT